MEPIIIEIYRKNPQIGEVLNQSENWARVSFYRGKEKLRKEMINKFTGVLIMCWGCLIFK